MSMQFHYKGKGRWGFRESRSREGKAGEHLVVLETPITGERGETKCGQQKHTKTHLQDVTPTLSISQRSAGTRHEDWRYQSD